MLVACLGIRRNFSSVHHLNGYLPAANIVIRRNFTSINASKGYLLVASLDVRRNSYRSVM